MRMKRISRIEYRTAVSAPAQQGRTGNGCSGMENVMKEKKMILIVSVSGGVVLLAMIVALAALIGSASRSAAGAARTFEALLSEGKLAELEARCYLPEERKTAAFPVEGADAQIRFVTPAELAERFGADAVLAGQETSLEEELLSVVMRYGTLRVSTGMVIGNRASARLTLTGPDFYDWLSSLEPEEAERLMEAGEGFPQALEELLSEAFLLTDALPQAGAADETPEPENPVGIPMRTVSQSISMQKRNGSWCFAVTEEQEREWFCGLLPAAASEPAAADGLE